MPANKLTNKVLRDAARLRFMELLTWEVIAKQLGCGESTLRKYNSEQEPRWVAAVEDVLAEMKRDALPTGYGCLLHAARYGDVSAARELINRCEGAVDQGVNINLNAREDLISRLGGLAARRRAGSDTGGPDGGTGN